MNLHKRAESLLLLYIKITFLKDLQYVSVVVLKENHSIVINVAIQTININN